MKIIGVIPARFGSTRFPGKPLALLQGKPLIQWTIEGARKSRLIHDLLVATDDVRIKEVVEKLGIKVIMTESQLASGSDRIYAAIENINCDVVVNIQGDEPLVTGELVDHLAQAFIEDSSLDMATLAHSISEQELSSMNSVKVVLNQNSEALYFSRHPIPYSRLSFRDGNEGELCLKHIGMYAYSKSFLKHFCQSPPAGIELAESLEQLRALYLGAKIKVIKVKEGSLGVDTPEDLERVEKFLSKGNAQ